LHRILKRIQELRNLFVADETALADASPHSNRRQVGLKVVLVILALANVFGFIYGATHRQEFFSAFPRFTPLLWTVYLLCPPAAILSFAAMWFRRKWGFWLACALGLIVFAIETYALGSGWHLARIVLSIGLLAFFTRKAWNGFV